MLLPVAGFRTLMPGVAVAGFGVAGAGADAAAGVGVEIVGSLSY